MNPPACGFDATTDYWQHIVAADALRVPLEPPYQRAYPARLPDGRYLVLPLRGMPSQPERCVASLIANQASTEVVSTLASFMAERVRSLAFDAIVGLPTLGLTFAPLIAQALGHSRYVPLGYSRKYWYREELSVPVSSITTPGVGKLLYADPNLMPLLAGQRVLVVDDAVSSGTTMGAGLRLLQRCGATVVGVAVAMRQGHQWRDLVRDASGEPIAVFAAFDSPRMVRTPLGWVPEEATA